MKRKRNPKNIMMVCPRCNHVGLIGEGFREIDCGSDTYEDDVSYTSQICETCGLYHSGWTDKWLTDCESSQDEENAMEYKELLA